MNPFGIAKVSANLPASVNALRIDIHNCIYKDANGTIWLGTDNDGVYILNEDGFIKWNLNDVIFAK